MVSKEELEKRIEMLNEQLQKLTADYNAILGAKQDCEYWLSQLVECGDNPVDNGTIAG